jgi:hypothetical protein
MVVSPTNITFSRVLPAQPLPNNVFRMLAPSEGQIIRVRSDSPGSSVQITSITTDDPRFVIAQLSGLLPAVSEVIISGSDLR